MKYKISFQGWETEVLMSGVPEKFYNHFKQNDLDVTLHMCGTMEDELSEEITDGINFDTKFECDNLYHDFGAQMDENVTMYVSKFDTNEEIYSCRLDKWEGNSDCEQDVCLLDFEDRYIMVGQIFGKGYISEYILELNDDEEFDRLKLNLLYHDIDEMYQLVTGVQYNYVDLECTGERDTIGKDERWYIEDNETRERTID